MCADLGGDGSDMLVLIQDPLNNLPFEIVWPDILTFWRGFDLNSSNRTLCHDAFLFSESIRPPITKLAAKGGALCNAYDKNPVLCITELNCLSMQVLRFCFSAMVFVSEVVFDFFGPFTRSPRFGEAELIRSLSVRPLQESFWQRESTPTPAARRNKCL